MIKNAEEAREIIRLYDSCEKIDADICGVESTNEIQARAYLAALNGPEVKALVEALEAIQNSSIIPATDGQRPNVGEVMLIANQFKITAKNALAQYRDAAKGE